MSQDYLISSRLNKSKNKAKSGSRAPKLSNKKVLQLSEVESALRALEVTEGARICFCNARKHPLNSVTPNCLNCGQIICLKNASPECPFCKEKLLSNDELDAIMAVLLQEKSDIESGGSGADSLARDKANSNLARLLDYQDTSAQRTKIIDQSSDFDVSSSAVNKWATATEQAEMIKKQQKMMKKQKKRIERLQGRSSNVISIDLKGNKVVMREATLDEIGSDTDSEPEEEFKIPSISSSASERASTTTTTATTDSSTQAPRSKKFDKKLISPAYDHRIKVGKHNVPQQPARLQAPEDDAFFEF